MARIDNRADNAGRGWLAGSSSLTSAAARFGSGRNLAPEQEDDLVWDPDLWREAAGVEASQHGRIDHVGLDPRLTR